MKKGKQKKNPRRTYKISPKYIRNMFGGGMFGGSSGSASLAKTIEANEVEEGVSE